MWVMVVVFLSTGNAFTIPGYSDQVKCFSAGSAMGKDLMAASNANKVSPPLLYVTCRQVE